MSKILNVAVVGCGEVAMTTHLPTLILNSHMYLTVALCDVSVKALEHCSKKFHIPATYTNITQMLAERTEIDVVFILTANEYHAVNSIECMNAGKHVMIEKPMALSHRDANAIEEARIKNGVVCFIAYMRRYATAFLRVKDMVKKSNSIRYVRVRDIIGNNAFFVEQSGTYPILIDDIPDSANLDRTKKAKDIFRQALGEKAANPKEVMFWNLLNSLASHDLSAMRELIGMPQKVLSVARHAGPSGVFLSVHFQYETFAAYYEMAIDQIKKFDAHIEVFTDDKHLKVTYDTPYIKGLPITATVLKTLSNGDFSEESIRPTYVDAYTLEYEDLYGCIVHGNKVKTSPTDAMQDLQIFDMIVEACLPEF
ncbi:hypothetical protein C348_06179 [Cryptococcus neoformans Gb118]|nr:hypothetical protein C350_06164 [Cryptococcus neoformans var. grubii MW-RSA36]OXL05699.1 hypothetical protein C348_06179 [Cryptococcus neoformans var. grubii Gb118]